MTADVLTLREIGRWLSRLDAITRRGTDETLADATLADLAVMLAAELPVAAFTTDSLAAVAKRSEWFPPFATLVVVLRDWWDDHAPVTRALPPPASPDRLSDMDRTWLAYWNKRQPEVAVQQARMNHARLAEIDPHQTPLAHLASLIRAQSPAAWSVISGMQA